MKKAITLISSIMLSTLLNYCNPPADLSKPNKAVECFLKDIKNNKNPMERCGYKEIFDGVGYYPDKAIDSEYYKEFGICADDIIKCLQQEGPLDNLPDEQHRLWRVYLVITREGNFPVFEGYVHKYSDGSGINKMLDETGVYPILKFYLQKESDGKWRVTNLNKSKLYFERG